MYIIKYQTKILTLKSYVKSYKNKTDKNYLYKLKHLKVFWKFYKKVKKKFFLALRNLKLIYCFKLKIEVLA